MSFNMNIPTIIYVYFTNGQKKIVDYQDDLTLDMANQIKDKYDTAIKITLEDSNGSVYKTFYTSS